jgi:thiosulfate/3-mercaptopyruvate sulfurtransferase
MSTYEDAQQANAEYASSFALGHLTLPPIKQLAVVTCMDARLTVEPMLGLQTGDAHVIRNAGGLVTDDALRSLIISHKLLGTETIFVINHTDCDMLTFRDEELQQRLKEETDKDAGDIKFGAFSDVEQNLLNQINRIRESPFLPASIDLHGFIYDVQTGKLSEVSLPEEEIMAEYANPDALVSTEWVAENMRDPKVRLVEVDVDTAAYDTGHLPGAVGWNWKTDLETPLQRDIADKEGLEKLLSRAGVDKNTTLVLYGDNSNWFAAYALWVLEYYGIDNAKLMNGGRKKWVEEGRELSTDTPSYSPSNISVKGPKKELRASRDQVLDSLDKVSKGKAALVDVRSPREYSGELLAPENLPQEGSQRGGHIPGAQNIVWSQATNEDGTFKTADQLAELYQSQGVTPDKDVIAYCRIGERSAHTWFVLNHLLGYKNVRNYDGSWTEWGSLVGAPIEK